MAEDKDIWVFTEKKSLLAELIAGAHKLTARTGGGVVVILLGSQQDIPEVFEMGAQRVVWLGDLPEGRIVEDVIPTLNNLVQNAQPYGVLIGATTRGRVISGRLAARLGTAALTDVQEFQFLDGVIQVKHLAFGGGAVRIDRPTIGPIIATIGSGVCEPLPRQTDAAGEIQTVEWVDGSWQASLIERRVRESSGVDLAAAKRVVCPGRGLKQQEDLVMIEELAQAIGAEVACTRPLAEGLNWLPRERYIGISGAMIKPELYIGIGVSGQAQHVVGMSESRVVVAINRDRSAPLVSQADYTIDGDLYTVVPALIRAVRAHKGN